jgi:hypothetical protein
MRGPIGARYTEHHHSPIANLATGLPADATDVSIISCGSSRTNTTMYDGMRSTNSMSSGVRTPYLTAIENLAMGLPAGATDVSIIRCGGVRSAYPDGYIVRSNITVYDGVRSNTNVYDGGRSNNSMYDGVRFSNSTGNGSHIPWGIMRNCGVSMEEAEKKFMYGNEKVEKVAKDGVEEVEKVAKDSVDEVNRKDGGTGGSR